jgi:hypothetical protein
VSARIRYTYRCPACGNTGEAFYLNDSHEDATAACTCCCEPVTLARDDGDSPPRWVEPPPNYSHEAVALWYDLNMHAEYWWGLLHVEPKNGAMLMCGTDPLIIGGRDPAAVVSDPAVYFLLLNAFETEDNEDPSVRRTLSQRHAMARQHGFPCHRWIDEWSRAKGIQEAKPNAQWPVAKGPPPLRSPVIAALFAGLNGWDEDKWKHNLGTPRLWLAAARVTKGSQRPGGAATWNPVTIAVLLAEKKVSRIRLDKIFDQIGLAAWRAEWQDKREYLS